MTHSLMATPIHVLSGITPTQYLSAGPPGLIWVIVRGLHFSLLAQDPPRITKPNVPPSVSRAIVCCRQRTENVSVGPEEELEYNSI